MDALLLPGIKLPGFFTFTFHLFILGIKTFIVKSYTFEMLIAKS